MVTWVIGENDLEILSIFQGFPKLTIRMVIQNIDLDEKFSISPNCRIGKFGLRFGFSKFGFGCNLSIADFNLAQGT